MFGSIETRRGAVCETRLHSSPKFGISEGNPRRERHWGRKYTTDRAALPICF